MGCQPTQLGLIAGGLVDGTVNLWNPAKIVGAPLTEEPTDGGNGCLITSLQKHTGAVCFLFNSGRSPRELGLVGCFVQLCICLIFLFITAAPIVCHTSTCCIFSFCTGGSAQRGDPYLL